MPWVSMVSFTSPRVAEVVEEDTAARDRTRCASRTLFSGISAGTELTAYRGSNPYLTKRGTRSGGCSSTARPRFAYPVDGWGYEEVGEVVEVGADGRRPRSSATVIWGTWGHRTEHGADRRAGRGTACSAPASIPRIGIFSQIGAIALNVVLDADIHVGETVAVFGLGVPGQIVAQLARLNGARVIGGRRDRLRAASSPRELGADVVLDAGEGAVAEQIRELTDGRGADVCLEVTGNYRALHEAIRSVAYSSRVCVAGFMQGDGRGAAAGRGVPPQPGAGGLLARSPASRPTLQHRWDGYRLAPDRDRPRRRRPAAADRADLPHDADRARRPRPSGCSTSIRSRPCRSC